MGMPRSQNVSTGDPVHVEYVFLVSDLVFNNIWSVPIAFFCLSVFCHGAALYLLCGPLPPSALPPVGGDGGWGFPFFRG